MSEYHGLTKFTPTISHRRQVASTLESVLGTAGGHAHWVVGRCPQAATAQAECLTVQREGPAMFCVLSPKTEHRRKHTL